MDSTSRWQSVLKAVEALKPHASIVGGPSISIGAALCESDVVFFALAAGVSVSRTIWLYESEARLIYAMTAVVEGVVVRAQGDRLAILEDVREGVTLRRSGSDSEEAAACDVKAAILCDDFMSVPSRIAAVNDRGAPFDEALAVMP